MAHDNQLADSTKKDVDGIRDGITMGKEAYDAAKKVPKVAAAVASGNPVLIAKEVATSKIGRALIAGLIVIIIMSTLFLHALPIIIMENVQQYYSDAKEEFKDNWSYVVSQGNSRAEGILMALLGGGEDLEGNTYRGAFIQWFKSFANSRKDESEVESVNGNELNVMRVQEDESDTLKRKREAVTNKINKKVTLVHDEVKAHSGDINNYFKRRFDAIKNSYPNPIYVPIALTCDASFISPQAVTDILTLYTVQNEANVEEIKISDVLFWVGQQRMGSGTIKFKIGKVDDPSLIGEVPTWEGDFMPQYLMSQARSEDDVDYYLAGTSTRVTESLGHNDYDSKYECSIADLLVVVDGDDFATLEPVITYVTIDDVTYTYIQWFPTVNVGCREPSTLMTMAGLWKGDEEEEQDISVLDSLPVGMGFFSSLSSSSGGASGEPGSPIDPSLALSGTNGMQWPLDRNHTHVSSQFGTRTHPVTHERLSFHNGVDLAATTGTPIFAAYDGVVIKAAPAGTFGNKVEIEHHDQSGRTFFTWYAHLSRFAGFKAGDTVKAGDCIGYVGATGRVTGPHLHFSVALDQNKIANTTNPLGYYPGIAT